MSFLNQNYAIGDIVTINPNMDEMQSFFRAYGSASDFKEYYTDESPLVDGMWTDDSSFSLLIGYPFRVVSIVYNNDKVEDTIYTVAPLSPDSLPFQFKEIRPDDGEKNDIQLFHFETMPLKKLQQHESKSLKDNLDISQEFKEGLI